MSSLGVAENPREELRPLFRMSLRKGTAPSVLLHIRRGAPVNGRDDRDWTPLMLAASAGRHEVCLLLLAEGADPSLTTDGRTAADMAGAAGHRGLADALRPVRTQLPPAPAGDAVDDLSLHAAEDLAPDADGWESEETFSPGTGDGSVAEAARDAQQALAVARDGAFEVTWQETDVSLPSEAAARALPDRDLVLKRLAALLARERVPARLMTRTLGRSRGLGQLAEDLGVRTDSVFGATITAELLPSRLDAAGQDRLSDAAGALEALAGERDADALYAAELARLPAVDRDAEQSMFRSLGEAKRQVIRSVISCLPLVEDVISARIAPGNVATGEDEDANGDPASVAGDTGAAGPADDGLLAALLSVRDGDWNADVERLAGFDLDIGLVADVCSALRDRRDGTELALRLSRTLDRYLAVRNRVIEANLPLVTRSAHRYLRPGVQLADLIQEGNIGLMRAVERFDITRGNRFQTFAIWWIRQACGRATEDLARTIRLPVHLTETCVRMGRCRDRLRRSLDREPDLSEIAAAADVPESKAAQLVRAWRRTVSIDDARLGNYAVRLPDAGAAELWEIVLAGERRRQIGATLRTLPARQERIIRSRFGLSGGAEQTLEEVGDTIGVTRERIRQLEHKTMVSLGRPGAPARRLLRQLL